MNAYRVFASLVRLPAKPSNGDEIAHAEAKTHYWTALGGDGALESQDIMSLRFVDSYSGRYQVFVTEGYANIF